MALPADLESLDTASLAAKVRVRRFLRQPAPLRCAGVVRIGGHSRVGALTLQRLRQARRHRRRLPPAPAVPPTPSLAQLDEIQRNNEYLRKENATLESYLQRHVTVRIRAHCGARRFRTARVVG
jgi:hypothetical protein